MMTPRGSHQQVALSFNSSRFVAERSDAFFLVRDNFKGSMMLRVASIAVS